MIRGFLHNFIPFYSEIELITLTKESIFHQLKEFKANSYYEKLWEEIVERMQWPSINNSKGKVVDIQQEQALTISGVVQPLTSQFIVNGL